MKKTMLLASAVVVGVVFLAASVSVGLGLASSAEQRSQARMTLDHGQLVDQPIETLIRGRRDEP